MLPALPLPYKLLFERKGSPVVAATVHFSFVYLFPFRASYYRAIDRDIQTQACNTIYLFILAVGTQHLKLFIHPEKKESKNWS